MTGKMYLNLVHRTETDPALMETVRFQQEECHKRGLKTTLLIGYPSMCHREIVDYVKSEGQRKDVELGISFHDIDCPALREIAGSAETVFYLLRASAREKIIDEIFRKFQEEFGFLPSSVASYILDGPTMCYIKKHYPCVKAAITNCFEEGVNMYAGNCNGWILFSDGGPWGAYYPSRDNHLIPAADETDYTGIVGLPHLNRDMVLSLTSRDDYFASHPVNIMRAKANCGREASYQFYFFDQWREQASYNGYCYYNVFVSAAWLTKGFQGLFVDNYLDARGMYQDALNYYRENCDRGMAECVTMTEFAEWYEQHVPIGTPEVNLWKELLCGTKRQNFWYVDPWYRASFDLNMGGTITDLRPYAAHWENSMGPDTKVLYDGSNPFLISSEHRNTEVTCYLEYQGRRVSIKDKRCTARTYKNEEHLPVLEPEPLRFYIGEEELTLYTRFVFGKNGVLTVTRRVGGLKPGEHVRLVEEFRGCYGRNQYPEDMHGIRLYLEGHSQLELTYQYDGRQQAMEAAEDGTLLCGAKIPQLDTEVYLEAIKGAYRASIEEGTLFRPFYTLTMEGLLENEEEMSTCLRCKKL